MALIVIALLFGLILLGMPIAFALMLSAAAAMWMQGIDLIMAPIQMFSGTNGVVLLAIPMFILMGELMGATSIAERVIDLAAALVGWIRGGLGHVNVLTSMFMAEMSGSAVADSAVMSKIFVPQMERAGYPKAFAAALTATSATLGIIIPPSIPMVLYGVATDTSIKDLFLAGIVPGVLLAIAYMTVVYLFAVRRSFPVDKSFEWPRLGLALRRAVVPLMIPVVVVGGLIAGIVTPSEAASIGVVAALIFGVILQKDLRGAELYRLVVTTVRQTAIVMMIIAGSAVLGQFLANQQIPQEIAAGLGHVTSNKILLLLLINVFLLFLGMFLHASAAIIVVVPLLLPLARQVGLDPVHFGVIVCLNLGIGQQTPPVASVLLTVCSVTGLKIEQVMTYGKWFILAMFVVLLVVSYGSLALW